MQKFYILSFLTLTAVASACGGKGDESTGGDGDTGDGDSGDGDVIIGDGDVGDGDAGDGDVGDGDAGDVGDGDVGDGDVGDGDVGDGDGGDGDGDAGDGDVGDGDVGSGGMGGATGEPGVPSTEGSCSGTAAACIDQGEDSCAVAGCTFAPGCRGDVGCEALESAMECNSEADALDCMYGAACSGTPDECTEHGDSLTCENAGCTWVEN